MGEPEVAVAQPPAKMETENLSHIEWQDRICLHCKRKLFYEKMLVMQVQSEVHEEELYEDTQTRGLGAPTGESWSIVSTNSTCEDMNLSKQPLQKDDVDLTAQGNGGLNMLQPFLTTGCKQPDSVVPSDSPLPSTISPTTEQSISSDFPYTDSDTINDSISEQVSPDLVKIQSDNEEPGVQPVKNLFENMWNYVEKEFISIRCRISEEVKYDIHYWRELKDKTYEYVLNTTDGPSEREHLEKCEQEILKDDHVNTFQYVLVDTKPDGTEVIIHCMCCKSVSDDKPSKFPLVLLHGYAGGVACFFKNYGSLCKKRNVYALDLPGFALSTRVEFKDNCTDEMVDLIEKWRSKMATEDKSLDKFIILGHSFGGYVATNYAMKYKEHVRHLILIDPWGVLSKEEEEEEHIKMRNGVENAAVNSLAIANNLLKEPILSLQGVRDLGEVGTFVFAFLLPIAYGPDMVPYIYLANKEEPATGEDLFNKVSYKYVWPQVSLKSSLIKLAPSVPISFLYGNKSPYHQGGSVVLHECKKNVHLDKELEAGHHPQVQDPESFNLKVNEICDKVDANEDIQ